VVWAPYADTVLLERAGGDPVPMSRCENGYYHTIAEAAPGALYNYLLNGSLRRPDPASRFQPEGVHGSSEVIACSYAWTDQEWNAPALANYVFYELHVGTFSAEGTLASIIPHLSYIKDLGVTAVELMPVAQFPGSRNWGYDGVFPFAAQNSYGGPQALKEFVNAAHVAGLAVVLDVVYNHLGPEGNYLRDFGPYFTERYHTPWGEALNFDGPGSDEVRRFFIANALYWVTDFHVDALRLDAVHAIVDSSARPFVQELSTAIHERASELNRRVYVIAESDLNDARVVKPEPEGGLGCDAVWSDSFHHALHTMLTGESDGYYQDFGSAAHLAKAYEEAFVYAGQYSRFRRRRHGNSARGIPGERFVVCAQNHDQIGNRPQGQRLSKLVEFEALKLAAGAVLLSPYLPLIFMGEEYGETAPFLYFTSHGDPELVEAVRRGRREEFAAFSWKGEVPDPQDESTFLRCRLTAPHLQNEFQHTLRDFYRAVLRLRRQTPALSHLAMAHCQARVLDDAALLIRRWLDGNEVAIFLQFSSNATQPAAGLTAGTWVKRLDSTDLIWKGPGGMPAVLELASRESPIRLPAKSILVYERNS